MEKVEESKEIIQQQIEKSDEYKGYMLMFNIQKQKNFGTLIRSAAAFNIEETFVVEGVNRKRKLPTFGSQGTAGKTVFRYFDDLKQVKEHCNQNNIYICGIEIMCNAIPVQQQPFRGNTLFMLGNEGAGLNKNQIAICDHFVYIPQYSNKTASLNVAIAGSIIFHHFAIWAGYKQQEIVGYKFEENDEKSKEYGRLIQTKGFSVMNDPTKKREQREQKKQEIEQNDAEGNINAEMFEQN